LSNTSLNLNDLNEKMGEKYFKPVITQTMKSLQGSSAQFSLVYF